MTKLVLFTRVYFLCSVGKHVSLFLPCCSVTFDVNQFLGPGRGELERTKGTAWQGGSLRPALADTIAIVQWGLSNR